MVKDTKVFFNPHDSFEVINCRHVSDESKNKDQFLVGLSKSTKTEVLGDKARREKPGPDSDNFKLQPHYIEVLL